MFSLKPCLNCTGLHAGKKGTHSAKFGALAQVFEKSATEVQHTQNLFKCKSTIHIVTFNFRTFSRIGQPLELTASVVEHNIEIYAYKNTYHHSEVGRKYHDSGSGWTFVSASAWRDSVNAITGG